MRADEQTVVIAFDGSDEARAAVCAGATLFGDRAVVVVSVWEPGLAFAMAPVNDPTGVGYATPSAFEMAAIDQAQYDHAVTVAQQGARLAEELGASAEPFPVPDEADVAETIAAVAEERDACAIVVGTRGLGGVKSRLFGSTSHELLHRTQRPVLVVKAPHQ